MIWIKILAVIALSFGSALAYRAGGKYQTLYRDLGVPLIVTLSLLMIVDMGNGFVRLAWVLSLHFILLFASLTTYYRFMNRIFGHRKDRNYWHNWLASGFMHSISALPLLFLGVSWVGLLIRTIVLTGLFLIVGEVIRPPENIKKFWDLSELLRGFIITLSALLLLI